MRCPLGPAILFALENHPRLPPGSRLPGPRAPLQSDITGPHRSSIQFARRRRLERNMAAGSSPPQSLENRLLVDLRLDLVQREIQ